MSMIEVRNLTKVYEGKIRAVNGISFKVEEGEVFGLLGPNGAGKTTTLSILATLLKPTSGTAKVNGFDVMKNSHEVRKSIGIVFQEPSSDDLLSGRENLYLHAMMFGVPADQINKRMDEALEIVDLKDRQHDSVKKYSGGMRRRLELARGLLHRPKILFLDEPTLGLDPQARETMWAYIQNLAEKERMTIIITTHYMEEADMLCDRVAIIDFGKIVVLDSPEKLKRVMKGGVIRLKTNNNTKLNKIKKLKFVKDIDISNGYATLTVKGAEKKLQQILRLVGDVESVELHAPTLNDVFLHYTGREIREASPEGGWFERTSRLRK